MADYTCGVRVKNPVNPRLHMTLAYLGEGYPSRVVLSDLETLSSYLPFSAKPCGMDLFGEHCDVPVVLVDSDFEDVLNQFYTDYGVAETWMDEKPLSPHYHITIKDTVDWISKQQEFILESLFVKQLGEYGPVNCWGPSRNLYKR